MYHFPGHQVCAGSQAGRIFNSYRYVNDPKRGWIVEMSILSNDETIHFCFDIQFLSHALNLEDSLLVEESMKLEDGTNVPKYTVKDQFVPTWLYSKSAGVFTSSWPKTGKNVRFARLITGSSDNRKVKHANGNNLDCCLDNLVIAGSVLTESIPKALPQSDAETRLDIEPNPIEAANVPSPIAGQAVIRWPFELNPNTEWLNRSTKEFRILKEFPGRRDDGVNPYQLVEYEGRHFYRMRALNGEEGFFSQEDLDTFLKVHNTENPTWYKATEGEKMKEAYIMCHPRAFNPIYMHVLVLGRQGAEDGLTVDHLSRNKWDNRRENLRVVTQGENNANRPLRTALPYIYPQPADKNGHSAGFALNLPLSQLPAKLRSKVKPSRSDKPLITVKSRRFAGVTEQQQKEHLTMTYEAMLDGTYFYEDGSVNEVTEGRILATSYELRFPVDVGYTVPHVEWNGRDEKQGTWRLGRCHPSVKRGSVKLPQSQRVENGETPRQTLARFYSRLLKMDPLFSVNPDMVQDVKRISDSDRPDSKRQKVE